MGWPGTPAPLDTQGAGHKGSEGRSVPGAVLNASHPKFPQASQRPCEGGSLMRLRSGGQESEGTHITPTTKARKIYGYDKMKIYDVGYAISILTKILLK